MTHFIRRREFVGGLGAAAVWPVVALGQQVPLQTVGFLDNTGAETTNRLSALRAGLSAAGFDEGRNIIIEPRWADGRLDQLPELAADLVRRRVSVIVTNNSTTPAARAATSTIPIVFVTGGDPIDGGLVSSLNRPGGNITGVSFNSAPINPKRFQLLNELVPSPTVIAALMDSNQPVQLIHDLEAAAHALGRKLLIVKAGNEPEIDAAFATIIQSGAGAVFVGTGAFYNSRRHQIVSSAARHALPASYHQREFVEIGGLMSYGASSIDAHHRAGAYVGRILKGEKPSDLPVELPTRYELVFNLATAKALKINIPSNLIALVDEVIE